MAIGDKIETDEDFWLNLGAEVIYNALQARKDAVDRLQKTIVWVFGVYTSISFASVMFGDKKSWDNDALTMFGFAFLFLIVAYWLATLAAFPSVKNFYANAQASVTEAFNKAINAQRRYFGWGIALSGIGTFLYALALLTQFSTGKRHPPVVQAADIPVKVDVKKLSDNNFTIDVETKKNSWHELQLLQSAVANGKTTTVPVPVEGTKTSVILKSDSTGHFHEQLPALKEGTSNTLLITRTDSVKGDELLYTRRIKFKVN